MSAEADIQSIKKDVEDLTRDIEKVTTVLYKKKQDKVHPSVWFTFIVWLIGC